MACLHHHLLGSDPIPFAEPGVEPSYPRDRAVQIVHAALTMTFDPAERRFSGEGRYRIEPYPAYAGRAVFDLDEVHVESVTTGDGAALTWELGDGELAIDAGDARELVIRWSGRDPRHGLYFTGPTEHEPARKPTAWTQCQDEDGHFVFPCHDHPSIKHPWSFELHAPKGYTLLSNGRHLESGKGKGGAFARYEQREPMPAYLVTFVAAPLSIVEREWRGRPVRYLVPPGTEQHVERAFGRTVAMLEHFSERIGVPYPWSRYDQVVVHDFVFGGMENVACTTMTDQLLVDEKAELEFEADGLVSHELAHQWFGDLVTCQDWSQGWLNESFATFMESVWYEHHEPGAEAVWYRWVTAQGYLAEHGGRYMRPIVSYQFRDPIDLFDRHLYNKGACVLWTLRGEIGEEAFWAGVRRYLERHANDTVHTRHLQRGLEEATGRNLERFFTQWVFSPGHPAVTVKLGREGDGLVTVDVTQTQQGDGVPEAFAFPLRVVVVGTGGSERAVVLQVTERHRRFVIPVDGPVANVIVDPEYAVLADLQVEGAEAWLKAQLAHGNPVVALRAARALLKDPSPAMVEAVVGALSSHPFGPVRGAIAGEIAKRANDRALSALVSAAASEADPRALRGIAAALGTFRRQEAADALLALAARNLPTWQLEGTVLVALGQTRDSRAVPLLTGRLAKESWADWVRQRALEGLAETEDPGVLEVLIAYSRPANPARTQAAAANALGRLADAVDAVRRRAVERLVEMLAEGEFRAQYSAIAALGRVRDPAAEAGLARVHRSAADGRCRRAAYEALVRVRQGRTAEESLAELHKRLDGLAEENVKLRDRLDRLTPS